MKKIKAMNGYTIYQATNERDVANYSCNLGNFNIYFSSDIRDYGLKMSYAEFEDIESLEICEELCNNNYAIAREIAEEESTCISFERVEEIEKQLDAGKTAEEIEEAEETEEAEEDAYFFITEIMACVSDSGKHETRNEKKKCDNMYAFRLLDDDGEIYFYGYCKSCDDESAFLPLDIYGVAYGCAEIQYLNNGEWETL